MCHDLSFSATTVEFISELLPNAIWDGQVSIDFSTTSHVISLSHRKCLVVYARDGQQYINTFEWGLMADFMDSVEVASKYRNQMANARSEKLFNPDSAWYKLRKQRCLIAVDGFYEHRKINGWKNKVPYFIKLANRTQLFMLGLYNYSHMPDVETGEMKGTFTILTRPANELMKQIHNDGENKHRMPVLMQPEEAVKWINEDLTDDQMKAMLDYEVPSAELEAWPVYIIRTKRRRPDRKEKFEPYKWLLLPPLGNDEPLKPMASLFD